MSDILPWGIRQNCKAFSNTDGAIYWTCLYSCVFMVLFKNFVRPLNSFTAYILSAIIPVIYANLNNLKLIIMATYWKTTETKSVYRKSTLQEY